MRIRRLFLVLLAVAWVIYWGLGWFMKESDCEIVLDHVQASQEAPKIGVEYRLACRTVRGGVQLGTVIGNYTYWDGKLIRQSFIDVLRAQRDGTMETMTEAEKKALVLNAVLGLL